MRRFVPVLVAMVALLAGCGGGGASSSSNASAAEAWSTEARAVIGQVRTVMQGLQGEFAELTPEQSAAEGMYAVLTDNVSEIATELEGTKAPEQCASLKSEMLGYTHQPAALAMKLGHQRALTTAEYGAFAHREIGTMAKVALPLGRIAAAPRC